MATKEELISAGGVVAEARTLVEDYAKTEIVTVSEPRSGTSALGLGLTTTT